MIGILADQFDEIGHEVNPFMGFVGAIPYQFYTIAIILMALLIATLNVDYGPMKRAEQRAYREGKLLRDGVSPLKKEVSIEVPEGANPTVWNMLAPLLTLIVIIVAMFLYTGGFPEVGVLEAIGN